MNNIKLTKTFLLILNLVSLSLSTASFAVPSKESTNLDIELNQPNTQSRFRFQTYGEIMSPAISGDHKGIPTSDGFKLAPANIDGRFWIDYEISENMKFLYWQRYFGSFDNGFLLKDPRIGIRKLRFFEVAGLETTYDLFIQPGITPASQDTGRAIDIGTRTNTLFHLPKSNFSIGILAELVGSIYGKQTTANDMSGFFIPYLTYDFNSVFSTQHYFVFPIKHEIGTSATHFQWDFTGMPFMQTGLGINVNRSIWVGLFLNNYLVAIPSLSNTWASSWISFSLI